MVRKLIRGHTEITSATHISPGVATRIHNNTTQTNEIVQEIIFQATNYDALACYL